MTADLSIDGYQIDRLLAKGGMAEVYLAEQTSLERKVAIKVLDSHSEDEGFVDRFLKEAKLVASLTHPNIITVHDFGVLDDERLYIVMEYVEGGDLDAKLETGLTEEESLQILEELANALTFIHQQNIIHRDIKPANVLFRADGTLILTDFGIAKQKDEDVSLTQAGTAVGSPAYSSPEQSQGTELDLRTDIYSLGVVFIEMLTGANPYKADSYINTSINHIQMPVPELQAAHQKYQTLINQMLAKDPQDRFSNAEELIAAIKQSREARVIPIPSLPIKSLAGQSYTKWAIIGLVTLFIVIPSAVSFKGYLTKRKQINLLLESAQARMESRDYIAPYEDSAHYYYKEVLLIDPDNTDAEAGLDTIVTYYYDRAKKALAANSRGEVKKYLNRGLRVDPDNEDLLRLRSEFYRERKLGDKVEDTFRSIFQ